MVIHTRPGGKLGESLEWPGVGSVMEEFYQDLSRSPVGSGVRARVRGRPAREGRHGHLATQPRCGG